ncbi:MAG: sialate O-acetylesterase [Gammaproteobacteria bacterium]|nr:9-O-acetylesterase [Gammaproteobacteria bacterium]
MRSFRRLGIAACWGLLSASAMASSSPATLFHELFQDHAVLQRDRPIPVWGRAAPGEQVRVSIDGTEVVTHADANGAWKVELPALPAGGPYTLTASTASGTTQVVSDVLVGDVWLCSGQSNMEMPTRAALNFWAESARAANDSIRLLTVARDTSATPKSTFSTPVRWQPTTSEAFADFSATCFYFARELQQHVKVPMGLIHASWGGSRIEPWMSAEALRAAGGFDEMLEILALKDTRPAEAIRRWGAVWERWWKSRVPSSQPWTGEKQGSWRPAPRELGHWEQWGDPELAAFNGMVWLRAVVELSPAQARQGATLSLGKIDDVDMTWVNGRAVGSTAGPDTDRVYEIPKGVLKAGQNTIVVNALDLWGPGGPWGDTPRALTLADGTSIPLDGKWEYQVVPPSVGEPPRAPWDVTAGLTMIANAMIAPLGSYRMRGVVWYQGESNTGEPERYETLLHDWMADWRARFGSDLSFLIVQLANFGQPPTAPTESGWAGVREAQRRAVARDGNAGLAVAIDLGDRWDIHPANKQQVGYRLARAARHVVYGEPITPSGPTPVRAVRSQDAIVVEFEHIDGKLVAYSSSHPIGFELCGAEPGSCEYALATIEGNSVRLVGSNVRNARRVRYCWADSPICTLYDNAPLPAGPFEVEIE